LKMDNQKYIATINNLTKLVTSEKKIEGDVLKLLMSGIHDKEMLAAQPNKGEQNGTDN
jgi:hypothetical protein